MFEKLKYLGNRINNYLLYEDMRYCFYCKHWGVVNWCNLKNKRTYCGSTCEEWEILE